MIPDHPQVTRIRGDARQREDLQRAVAGAEVVLVTLGTGTSMRPTTLYTDAGAALVDVLPQIGSPPLIVLTGFGAGDSWEYNRGLAKLFFRFFLRAVYENKTAMEKLIIASYPRWEMVRPGRLTNGPMTEKYRVLTDLHPDMRVGAISRADVAHFMVAEAEQPSHLGAYPALSQ